MTPLAERISAIIREAFPGGGETTPLHEPRLSGNEWRYVKECLDTGWVSSVGSYVDRFEAALREYTGARSAVAVVNGTAALHVALLLAGVEKDDEVLLPALTFVATANAVSYCGAVPHFADAEYRTLGLDPARLERHLAEVAELRGDVCHNRKSGRRIKAVVPMHAFGHPVDLDPLAELCTDYRLTLVEDAAESLGSFYRGRHTGRTGKLAALSFNGNKIVTTGGGGAILTDDEELGRLARHLTTTAKRPHRWEFFHDRAAFNYRLPNVNAAIGCAQLEQLAGFVAAKRALAARYARAFAEVPGIGFFNEPPGCASNFWLNVLLLEKSDPALRDRLLEELTAAGIQARPAWVPLHRLPMYAAAPRMELSVTEDLAARIINIPSSAPLSPPPGAATDEGGVP